MNTFKVDRKLKTSVHLRIRHGFASYLALIIPLWFVGGCAVHQQYRTDYLERDNLFGKQAIIYGTSPQEYANQESWKFSEIDIQNMALFARTLEDHLDPVSKLLYDQLPITIRNSPGDYLASGKRQIQLAEFVRALNVVAKGKSIYTSNRFENVPLRIETKAMLFRYATNDSCAALNRMLLEDRFKYELRRKHTWVRSIIEFDDQGEFWDRRQLENTLAEIQNLANLKKPITLVVYVHGWKHNASEKSTNLKNFDVFMADLASVLNDRSISTNTPIVGVYLAWRGGGLRGDTLLENLTVYSRWNAAERVAGPSCTEAMFSVIGATRDADFQRLGDTGGKPGDEHSRVLVFGHSMGGLIVERALTQAMLGNILVTGPKELQARANIAKLKKGLETLIQEASALEGKRKVGQDTLNANNVQIKALSEAKISLVTDQVKLKGAIKDYETYLASVQDFQDTIRAFDKKRDEIINKCKLWSDAFERFSIFLNDNGDVTPGTRSSDASESRPNDNPALDRPLTQLNKTAEVLKQHLDALTNTSSQRLKTETRAQLQKHQRALAKISLEISDYYMSQRNSWSKLQADRDEATRLLSTAPSRAVEYSTTTSQSLSNEIKRGEIEAEILALEVTNKVIFQDGEHTFRALLENSRCQGSTNATIRGAQREIKPAPADLVVLINPAASSIVAKKMITAFKEPRTREFLETKSDVGDQKPEREEREWTRPWIISITSEADNATGTILPIAKGLGSVFKHFRENTGEYSTDIYEDELKAKWIQRSRTSNSLQLSATPQPVSNLDLEDQRFYATHTPPHSEALSSHFLLTNGTPVYLTDKSDARQALAYNLRSELPPNVFETRKHRFKILPKPWAWNNTAYWVINAPSELIPGHNEFWNPDFYALVGGLYRLRRDFDDLPQPNRTNQTPDQVSAVGSLISK